MEITERLELVFKQGCHHRLILHCAETCKGIWVGLYSENRVDPNFFSGWTSNSVRVTTVASFIKLSVHICVPHDGRDAARLAASSATAETVGGNPTR